MSSTRCVHLLVVLAALTACGRGGDATLTQPPVDTVKATPRDPYATIFIENLLTPAAGKLYTSYELSLVLDTSFTTARVAFQGDVGPGEKACTQLAGYVGLKTLEIAGVADTVQLLGLTPIDTRKLAAIGTATWSGMVRLTSGIFDPLVSADTSRGHTRFRPVMWRWTITDAGTALREDSLTQCVFP